MSETPEVPNTPEPEIIPEDSILNNVKQFIGYRHDYEAFDADIKMLINSELSTLNQIGVGPKAGFRIMDHTATWTQFLEGRTDMEWAKDYVAIRVRLIHDPPTSSYVLKALEDKAKELEWRLNFRAEGETEDV